MVVTHRLGPGQRGNAQLLQKFSRIGDIDMWIEGLFQIGERIWVVIEIHLHATDIDIADSLGLERPHVTDGLFPRVEKFAACTGSDRPWPGKLFRAAFIPTPRFGQRNCLH